MDGNGRWATRRGLDRVEGHRRGTERVREVVTRCRRIGIRCLTLYAFSTENWSRPKAELYFTNLQWPEFGSCDLDRALEWFRRRHRRFGAVNEAVV